MPTYTYFCNSCEKDFELFSYIKDYNPKPKCSYCNSKSTNRLYAADVATQSASVKKSDSELKTIGDLALRNSERMSDDQKTELFMKHNSYKENAEDLKPLPQGMKRVKKPPKTQWPGTVNKRKRRKLNES